MGEKRCRAWGGCRQLRGAGRWERRLSTLWVVCALAARWHGGAFETMRLKAALAHLGALRERD
jgi:hypothetical protein